MGPLPSCSAPKPSALKIVRPFYGLLSIGRGQLPVSVAASPAQRGSTTTVAHRGGGHLQRITAFWRLLGQVLRQASSPRYEVIQVIRRAWISLPPATSWSNIECEDMSGLGRESEDEEITSRCGLQCAEQMHFAIVTNIPFNVVTEVYWHHHAAGHSLLLWVLWLQV